MPQATEPVIQLHQQRVRGPAVELEGVCVLLGLRREFPGEVVRFQTGGEVDTDRNPKPDQQNRASDDVRVYSSRLCFVHWLPLSRHPCLMANAQDRKRQKKCGPERFLCVLRYGILGRLHRASLDHLASWLGLEDRRLLDEGIDALALLGSGLLDDDHAHEAGNDEDSVLLQLGVTDAGHGFDDALHVLAGEVGGVC